MHTLLRKLSCALWGHHVDNHAFKASSNHQRQCRCGSHYLGENPTVTRVRHTLSCFLGTHHYEKLADRDGCHEYVCTQCGHPLLFDAEHDPYAASATFRKKVRYLCGVFGHRVRHVATRHGLEEYACFCGHSFLEDPDHPRAVSPRDKVIRHPAICVVSGHFIYFLTRRGGFAEYVCRNCGHPFCFAYNPAHPPSREALRRDFASQGSAHEAGHLGHIHGTQVHEPVSAVVGAAHRI
jgi:hypothetical protein